MDIDNGRNIRIQNNVFYKGRVFHVRALNLYNYKFEENLMIAATKRPTISGKELIACYGSWNQINQVEDLVTVTDNVCQGSDLHGFALAYVPCDEIDNYPFAGNTVGSAAAGYIFTKVSGSCMAASGIKAYACQIGQVTSSPGT